MNNVIISSKNESFALYDNIIDLCKAFDLEYKSENHSKIEFYLNKDINPNLVIYNLAGFISDFKIFDTLYRFLANTFENGEIFLEKFYNTFESAYKPFIQYAHDITYIIIKNYLKKNPEIKIDYFLDLNLKDLEKDLYVILNNRKNIVNIFKKFEKNIVKNNNLFFTALKNIKNNTEMLENIETLYFEPQDGGIVAIDNLGDYIFFDDLMLNEDEILDLDNLDPYHYIIAMSVLVNPKTVVLYTSFNNEFLKNFFKFIEKNKKYIGSLCGKIEFTTQKI